MPDVPRGYNFVKRIYPPRIAGTALGFVCVAAVLYQHATPAWVWALLLFHGFAWAHCAYLLGMRSRVPFQAELRHLLIDSLLAGFWVPAMQFNLLPSVVVLLMPGMDNIASGGLKLFLKGIAAQLAGAAIAVALLGFSLRPESSPIEILGSLPILSLYPIIIGIITYRLSLKLSAQKKELQTLSRTDGLSGLHNRGFWEERANIELARARRQHIPAALMLLDIDYFKRVNDDYGHATGDTVLRNVAQLLLDNIRRTDLAGRYGGEEFVILLPDERPEGAQLLAERLRKVVESAPAATLPVPCTISIGVAHLRDDIADLAHWLDIADRALYQAKQQGRNRVVIAQSDGEHGQTPILPPGQNCRQ